MPSIEVVLITSTQQERILQAQESHFLDLKSIDIKPEKLSKSIMEYLNTNVEITNRIARQLTGVGADAVKLAFNQLKDRGLIELIPGKLRWRRIREGDQPLEILPTRAELYPIVEKLVMEYLDSHEEITNRTAREITGIESGTKMKKFFYSMRNKGLIELIHRKSTAQATWRKVKRNNC